MRTEKGLLKQEKQCTRLPAGLHGEAHKCGETQSGLRLSMATTGHYNAHFLRIALQGAAMRVSLHGSQDFS